MEKKFKASEIHLKIDNTIPFYNDNFAGLIIEWSSDIGFGQYEIYQAVGSTEWYADSEYMDINEDKEFIRELMRLFIEKLDIIN